MTKAVIERAATSVNETKTPDIPNRHDRALILTLGILGIFPDVFIGYLSSAFINNVLVQKNMSRALPIISLYLILTVLRFAQQYSCERMEIIHNSAEERVKQEFFKTRIRISTMLLNSLFVFLIDVGILVSCAVLFAAVWISHECYARMTGNFITYHASGSVMMLLRVSILFVCGLFVMRGSISIGELYAASLFANAIFSQALDLFQERGEASSQASGTGAESLNTSPPEIDSAAPALTAAVNAAKNILSDKKAILCTIALALIGTFCQGIYMRLQRICLGDCIPAGDWNNLLRNCVFMCCVTLCVYISGKGNQIGFRQIFNGKVPVFIEENLDTIADFVFAIIIALYYLTQVRRYDKLLATYTLLGSLLACVALAVLLMSGTRRKIWGEDVQDFLEMLSRLFLGCIVSYMYCALALQVTSIPIGDFIVLLSLLDGIFYGITSLGQMILMISSEKEKNRALVNSP